MNELHYWRRKRCIQTSKYEFEIKSWLIQTHTSLIVLNIEIEQKENSSRPLSLKAIETNVNQIFFVLRYWQSIETEQRSSKCSSIDSVRYRWHHSKFSENQCTVWFLKLEVKYYNSKRKNQAMNQIANQAKSFWSQTKKRFYQKIAPFFLWERKKKAKRKNFSISFSLW